MQGQLCQLLDSLAASLASLSAHLRGEEDDWGVSIAPSEAGWLIVSSRDRKPFLEVEIGAGGTVQLRPVEEETLTYSDSSFSSKQSKPARRTFKEQYSKPLAGKPQFRSPLWKRDLNIELCSEDSVLFTELGTPSSEGPSNIPAEFTCVWRDGTKSCLEEACK